jgi:hypothetical protein
VKRTIIFAVLILICAFAVYLYAHRNWNSLPVGSTIDRIFVEKSLRRLSIFRDGKQIKIYRIALGRNPVGAKQEEGDMKTPEGVYKIDGRNPQSGFHLAQHICYPSAEDDKRAAAHGVSAGYDIMIHGIQKRARLDWRVSSLEGLDRRLHRSYRRRDRGTLAGYAGWYDN